MEEAIDELHPFEGQSGKVCYIFVQNFSDKTYDNWFEKLAAKYIFL